MPMFWRLIKPLSFPVFKKRVGWLGLLLVLSAVSLEAQSQGRLAELLRENGRAFKYFYQPEPFPPAYQRLGYLTGAAAVAAFMPFDGPLSQNARNRRRPWKNSLAAAAEPWGNPRYVLPASALSYGLAFLIQPGTAWEEVSGDAFRSLAATSVAVIALKYATGRRRPASHPDQPYRFFRYRGWDDTPSFPSGHAALAFALASSLSRSAGDKWWAAVPLYGLAAATAWQRVYDGRHWPSDVVAGALLGTILGRSFTRPEPAAVSFRYQALPGAPLGLTLAWRW
ncbi:MAG: phosphatase PAP2 family protein [Schleiferiaceae bacterium]|nr:phosphatase PAP2 family protein [Schleiferiaceae bacterium]